MIEGRAAYIYDSQILQQRVEKLKQKLPVEIDIHYAIKANPMPELVDFLADKVDGFDVASGKELLIAINSGMPVEDISFAGPGKSVHEIEVGVNAGILFNLESETELERIVAASEKFGIEPRVAIRVNPAFELKASGMKMGGGSKQFGIDEEKVPHVIRKMNELGIDPEGFHIFSGSQNLRKDAIIESQIKAVDLAIKLANGGLNFKKINIGGGFGIPYFIGEDELELDEISENLSMLDEKLKTEIKEAKLIVELGRYISGTSGYYICEVLDIKESREEKFVIVNGGIHHHLAATGNFGQVIRKNYPIAVANKMESDTLEKVNIVGPCCTPLDIFAAKVELPSIEIGDHIVIFQSGAYGYSASPHDFLGHGEPRQLFVTGN
ncbi:MAG: pyridoxal-dependent decarboxylase, exosortase A system-associated [Gammaproteobacteria bacterium]|nr:MAG: pyridoxal-dependent decarboxylase, exosortase A system-associated [Gammaproteobacteria bacterium]